MPKYLITGGAGFIGSSIAEALLAEAREAEADKPIDLSPIALRTLLDRISDGSTLAVDSDLDSIDGFLEPSNEINLYRIVQESLSNVLKHAQARSVHVRLSRLPNEVELTIRDDGRGFDPLQLDDAHAFGLRGLEERGRILGGRLVIQSRPGNGTTVLARFPTTQRPTA